MEPGCAEDVVHASLTNAKACATFALREEVEQMVGKMQQGVIKPS